MRWLALLLLPGLLIALTACQHVDGRASWPVPEPPAIPAREILRPSSALPGERIKFEAPASFTLFLPEGWSVPADGGVCLSMHFHGSTWFVIDEHVRRGAGNPLASFNRDGGPPAYREAFVDPDALDELLRAIEEAMKERGAPSDTRITSLEVSTFGAGYGAAAQLLQRGRYFSMIHSVLLLDPMDDDGMTPTLANAGEAFVRFAREARKGRKTLLITRSGQAGLDAAILLAAAGAGSPAPVVAGGLPASSIGAYPLRSRIDDGGMHVWLYGGTDEQAHLSHLRHAADFWNALDGH
jgi:hypothetical protein